MVISKHEIEEIIVLYLKGEASPEQAIALEDWKLLSPENERFYLEVEKVFSLTHNTTLFTQPNVEQAWMKVSEQIHDNPTTSAEIIPIWKRKSVYMAVAAVAIVALVIQGLWREPVKEQLEAPQLSEMESDAISNSVKETTIYAAQQLKSVTLEDSSIVELESGSKLIVAADYNKGERRAQLQGSGTFHVEHDETNPFILTVEGMEVYDIGTIFRIDSGNDTVRVIVDEGAVELRLNGETLSMVEGDSAFYVISQQLIKRYESPLTRQDKVFEFDGTSLSEVVVILSDFFKRDIVVANEEIRECPLSVTFKNEPLAVILDIIEELLDVNIVHNQKTIEIHGNACI